MTREDIPQFVDCAAASYSSVNYPLNDYIAGNQCTQDDLRAIWKFSLDYYRSRSVIYADSPKCNGWVLWMPPGSEEISVPDFIRYGGLKMVIKLGISSLRRVMHYEDYCTQIRMQNTKGKEWYLYNLVVRPEAQGQHLASKLIKPMQEFSASRGLPVFLETHLEKNVGLYQHFGFDVVSDDFLPGTKMTHWGMVKRAVTSENEGTHI